MSYLARPRLAFSGTDAMTNPSTANNENVVHLVNYNKVELINPPQVDDADLMQMSDAAYREWMTSLITYARHDPTRPAEPRWKPAMPGYWNYWGDHLTTFGRATISSSWVGETPVTDPTDDPILGSTVVFNARIVDLNPADTYCSQLVAAHFSVVGPDRDGQLAELVRGVPTTSTTRWLNFHRYKGAGTFHAVVRHDTLHFIDADREPDSPGFRELRRQASESGGLLLRWCLYGMTGEKSMSEMYNRFRDGEKAANPKFGSVVGSIGVWNGDDPVSVPVGRVLHQLRPPYFAAHGLQETLAVREYVKSHSDVERVAPGEAAAADTEIHSATTMGPAVAVVEGNHVILDLGTAFPEGRPSNRCAKHDFGVVNLELIDGAATTVLGSVPYDASTYCQLGGVCSVAFQADSAGEGGVNIDEGTLQLTAHDGRVLLREIDIAHVVTDDQAVYLDLRMGASGAPEATGSAHVRVYRKGKPIENPMRMTVQVWADETTAGRAGSVNPLVVMDPVTKDVPAGVEFEVMVPAGGEIDVPIHATAPGCYKLRYIPDGMDVSAKHPNFSVEYFSCYRVLPYDDYSHVADDAVTFDYVYREVFSYYAILYPVMSQFIPWGPVNTPHDAARVAQFASLIKDSIDDRRRGTTLEMPITRELSEGKRILLRRWCDRQLRST